MGLLLMMKPSELKMGVEVLLMLYGELSKRFLLMTDCEGEKLNVTLH